MDDARFWSIAGAGAETREPEKVVAAHLERLEPDQLLQYQSHFDRHVAAAYTWDLWGACYLIGGGCSDDGFEYFLYGLIARGRTTYEAARRHADTLADLGDLVDLENEDFGHLANRIYDNKTGGPMPPSNVPRDATPKGEQWDFEDRSEVVRRLPRLSQLAVRLQQAQLETALHTLDEARKRLGPKE